METKLMETQKNEAYFNMLNLLSSAYVYDIHNTYSYIFIIDMYSAIVFKCITINHQWHTYREILF